MCHYQRGIPSWTRVPNAEDSSPHTTARAHESFARGLALPWQAAGTIPAMRGAIVLALTLVGCVQAEETLGRRRDASNADRGDVALADGSSPMMMDARVEPAVDASNADRANQSDASAAVDGASQRDATVADVATVVDTGPTCATMCRAGQSCVMGECRCGAGPACGASEECCADACVDTRASASHCGRCGVACRAGESCMAGACVVPVPVCSPGCDVAQGERCAAPGVCVCGASGAPCAAGTSCRAGRCLAPDACDPDCAAGLTCCNRRCVDTRTDANNCGGCGTTCAPVLEQCCAPLGLGRPACTPFVLCR
jgi:hypothetical protein